MTSTGFTVKRRGQQHRRDRLALGHMNEEIEHGRQKRHPQRLDRDEAGDQKDHNPGRRSEDRHIVQQERDRSPQQRVAEAGTATAMPPVATPTSMFIIVIVAR